MLIRAGLNKGTNPPTKKAAGPDKDVSKVTKVLSDATLDASTRTKSKNLDVPAEYAKAKKKNEANFVVIGKANP
jgi:elongation factor 1 alpha-like protein